MWARKHIVVKTCPRSYITAESLALVEEFFVRRRLGMRGSPELAARQVDAFVILEKELAAERNDAQQHTRQAV